MQGGAPGSAPQPPMRERIARARVMLRRGFAYWRMASFLFVVAAGVALFVAMNVKRVYKSEVTVIAKPGLRTDDKDESSAAQRVAKMTGDLKDALTTESHLEGAIQKFKLYRRTVDARGLKDATDEMAPHVGFRAKAESGRYVISFDSSEIEGRSTQDLVRDVTEYLAKTLIQDYASGDLKAKQDQLDFDQGQEAQTTTRLEKATKELALFLLAHPEFAMDAKQAATQSPLGIAPNPALGIPLAPNNKPVQSPAQAVQKSDPALAALYQSDGQLGALWRQRTRLSAEIAATAPTTTAAPTPAPALTSTAAVAALEDQINAAQADVEGAAKRVAETQGDLASKQSTLGPDNPDLKTAQAAANAAATQLHQAKMKLATLQAQKLALQTPAAVTADNPYDTAPAPNAQNAQNAQNAELVGKLHDIDSQIATREAELKKQRAAGTAPTATDPNATAPGPSGSAGVAAAPVEPVNPIVQLETEYLRLFRELTTAKSANERAKVSLERAQTAVEASRAAADDVIQIEQHAYRPTSPSKGGRTPAAALGMFVALLIAVLYAAARVVFNDTLIDAYDVDALQLIPVLGVVPKLHAPVLKKEPNGGGAAAGAVGGRGATGGV